MDRLLTTLSLVFGIASLLHAIGTNRQKAKARTAYYDHSH